jgi:hypothetical protein
MLFKSKKNSLSAKNDQPSDIKVLLHSQLRRFSVHLSRKLSGVEQQLSLGQKKVIITLFSLVFGCLFIALLYRGLFEVKSATPSFLTTPRVSVPIVPHLPDSILARRQFPKARMPIDSSQRNSFIK